MFRTKNYLPLFLMLLSAATAMAQENYFVTYSHQMEEPGNLEVSHTLTTSAPKNGNAFFANSLELEYGWKAWWTSELYLDSQSTRRESSIFTGFKLENRFRMLMREHFINPVFYVEFADTSADKSMREVVGHDGNADFLARNDRAERKREVELKLILSSNFKGWNVSENFIAEKPLVAEPWEFGYALGASRPLALKAGSKRCNFCRENLALGAEMYGGLGDRYSFGLKDTSHYLAPVVVWRIPRGPDVKFSPGFGLNGNSHGFVARFAVSYEFQQIFAGLRRAQ